MAKRPPNAASGYHTIEVEKDVPMPRGRGKYPWRDMEVGDSFFVPSNGRDLGALLHTISSNCAPTGARLGMKFRARVDNKNNGVRVWRTE